MAEAYDTLVTGLDTLQEGFTLQWEKLCEMQAQQLAKEEVATVMRHLEEVVDALHALQAPAGVAARQWPWWVHPSGYTGTALVVILLMFELLSWRPVRALVCPPLVQSLPQTQKGRK